MARLFSLISKFITFILLLATSCECSQLYRLNAAFYLSKESVYLILLRIKQLNEVTEPLGINSPNTEKQQNNNRPNT